MSKNLTETFYSNENFNIINTSNSSHDKVTLDEFNDSKTMTTNNTNINKKDEANKLFDLINQLNDRSTNKTINTNGEINSNAILIDQEQQQTKNMSLDLVSQINHHNKSQFIQTFNSNNNEFNCSNTTKLAGTTSCSHINNNYNEIEDSLKELSLNESSENKIINKAKSGLTKIPRIPNLKPSTAFQPKAPLELQQPENKPNLITPTNLQHEETAIVTNDSNTNSNLNSPRSSITSEIINNFTQSQTFQTIQQIQNQQQKSCIPKISRVARSTNKSSGVNSTTVCLEKNALNTSGGGGDENDANLNNYDKNNNISSNSKHIQIAAKRGISLSTHSVNKASRSMSINGDDSSVAGDTEFNKDGTVNVRYVVRHKPKESKVKIFSQKVEIKNVHSKIGSLEKANYVPGGGNVVIETKPLSWNAQSKIGSLNYANYQPNGGNVKIEHHKLNWSAQSKIRSLEYANYQPKGGNVKIESHKLNFKEKAKPKTDTGLIVIETRSDLFSSNYNSQSNSNDRLNDSRRISIDSNEL